MAEPRVLGVDIGGTALKLGLFDADGALLADLQRPTPQPATPGSVCMELVEAIDTLDPERKAALVGIGLPGPMDAAARVARVCINLPGWEEVPLAAWLEPRLQRLTLGTGVGGGVMLGGTLFTGHNGAAAEPGLITLNPEGPDCNSGNQGSLEQFASISGLGRLSDEDPAVLAKAASLGDAEALMIWREYGRLLGIGITSLVYVFTPQLVLVGGGLAGASAHFLPAVRQEVAQRVQAVSREGLCIEACALGNGAGRLGAARLAMQRLS
jgi:glucokinase